MPQQPTGTV
ncbi:hypothetical protein D039_0329A, partial [Vibrio parahaemolyticus EKP-028]